MSFNFNIDNDTGEVDINGVDDINELVIVPSNVAPGVLELKLGNFQTAVENQIGTAKLKLEELVKAFGNEDVSTKVLDLVSFDPSITFDDNKYKNALAKLLSWKKQVIKAYVYIIVLEHTTLGGFEVKGPIQERYERLKSLLEDSTRIILNVGALG